MNKARLSHVARQVRLKIKHIAPVSLGQVYELFAAAAGHNSNAAWATAGYEGQPEFKETPLMVTRLKRFSDKLTIEQLADAFKEANDEYLKSNQKA